MTFAECGEAYREAWRCLSRSENTEIVFLTHYQYIKQELFAEVCSLLHFVGVPKINVVPSQCQKNENADAV